MAQADALLLGRKTWQIHGGAFEPMPANDPIGGPMNEIHKYVVSTTLKSMSAWRNSTPISDNVVEKIRELKQLPGKDILLDGSSVPARRCPAFRHAGVLVHTLIENDLVDEYALHVYPLVLGNGKRLFPDGKYVNPNSLSRKARRQMSCFNGTRH